MNTRALWTSLKTGMNTCAPYSYLGWTHVLRIPTWDEHMCSVFPLGMNTLAPYSHLGWTHVPRIPTWDEHMCSVFPLGINTRAPYSHLGWTYVLRIPTWDEHMSSYFHFQRYNEGISGIDNTETLAVVGTKRRTKTKKTTTTQH
jgi:hypothetical protein